MRAGPAGCRGAFEGGARGSLTSPSEAHRKSFLGQAAACRNGAFEGGARGSLTLPSEAHRKSFLGQAAACRNVCGRGPWVKRRGRLRTGDREAAAGLPAAEERLRAGPAGLYNVAFGSRIEKKLSGPSCGLQERRGRGRPAGCRGAFEGGARGSLTSPSEAHRKSFPGQAAACRNVCGRGLPAAEERLRAGPVGL